MRTIKHIPALSGQLLLGSLPDLLRDRAAFYVKLAQTGPVSRCRLAQVQLLSFNTSEYIRSLMVNEVRKTWKGRLIRRAFTGNGIFTSEGDFHDRQRRIMAPSLSRRTVATYADIMGTYAEQLASSWHDQHMVDLNLSMEQLTTRIVSKTLFDVDVEKSADFIQALTVIFDYAAHMMQHPLSPPASWRFPAARKRDHAWAFFRQYMRRLINDRLNAPDLIRERTDVLSLLLNARDEEGNPMDEEQLIDEAGTLFTGGQETVASALMWVWVLLCQHPTIYQRLQQEVDSVLQGRRPTCLICHTVYRC